MPGERLFWPRSLMLDKYWKVPHIRSSPLWDTAWCRLLAGYWHLGQHLWCHLQDSSSPTTNLHYTIPQKSEELSYTVAKVQNHTYLKLYHPCFQFLITNDHSNILNDLCYKQESSKQYVNAEVHQNYFIWRLFCQRQRQPQHVLVSLFHIQPQLGIHSILCSKYLALRTLRF